MRRCGLSRTGGNAASLAAPGADATDGDGAGSVAADSAGDGGTTADAGHQANASHRMLASPTNPRIRRAAPRRAVRGGAAAGGGETGMGRRTDESASSSATMTAGAAATGSQLAEAGGPLGRYAVRVHPRTHELLDHLTRQRDVLRAALDATAPASRSVRPAPDRWSIAEVLEHLAIVERQVTALLRRGVQKAEATGRLPDDPDTAPVLPTIDGALLLDRERRVAAGPQVQPKGAVAAEATWQVLAEQRRELLELLAQVDGKRTDAVQAPHPVLGALTFQQWIAFLGYHEARHAAQIRAVMHELAAR